MSSLLRLLIAMPWLMLLLVTGCLVDPTDIAYTGPGSLDAQDSDMRLVSDMATPAVDMPTVAKDLSVPQDAEKPPGQDMPKPQKPDMAAAKDMEEERDTSPQKDMSQDEDMATGKPDMPPKRCNTNEENCDCSKACETSDQYIQCRNQSCDVHCLGVSCKPYEAGDGSAILCKGKEGTSCEPECSGNCTVTCQTKGSCKVKCTGGRCTLICIGNPKDCEIVECKKDGNGVDIRHQGNRYECGG